MSDLWSRVVEGARKGAAARTAVTDGRNALSWGALLEGARGIASALIDRGIRPGDRVGIWMEKSPRTIQVLLGTLAAGAAYVPVDPKSPWRRCASILENAGIRALALDAPRAEWLPHLLGRAPCNVVLLDGNVHTASGGTLPLQRALKWSRRPLPPLAPDTLAYILYTSGSTGTPKGVAHTHASGLAFVDWVLRTFPATPSDFFASHAPLHFDLSILDVFAALAVGARVRLFNTVEAMAAPWLARTVRQEQLTVWYSVPTALIAMMEHGDLEQAGWPSMRTVFFAGEVFPTPQLRRLRRALPHVELANLYGPTETNVCTFYRVPASIEGDGPIPIGSTCDHLASYVLDDQGQPVSPGEEGTLWISGPNLMRGYFGDPQRTVAALVRHPAAAGEFTYCTGDRVRQRADGGFDFHGRRDHQVKRRGYRIELGEIEAALAAHPAVLEAVAWTEKLDESSCRILAVAVPGRGKTLDENELRAWARERLPIYMLPDALEVRAELPRTSTGKVDRGALAAETKVEGTA